PDPPHLHPFPTRRSSDLSLLGAWVASLGQAPNLRRRHRPDDRSTLPLFDDAGVREALKQALPVRFSLESIPGDTLDEVRAKEQRSEEHTSELQSRGHLVC